MKAGQPFSEPGKARKRRSSRVRLEVAAIVESCADTQHFALRVEAIDLVAFDASDFEPKAVGPHVDDRQCRGGWRSLHRSHSILDACIAGAARPRIPTGPFQGARG